MLYFVVSVILSISSSNQPPVDMMFKSADEMGFISKAECEKESLKAVDKILSAQFEKKEQGVTVKVAVKCEQTSTGS